MGVSNGRYQVGKLDVRVFGERPKSSRLFLDPRFIQSGQGWTLGDFFFLWLLWLVLFLCRSAFLEGWLHESKGLVMLFTVVSPASRTVFPAYSKGLRNNCGRKGKREGGVNKEKRRGGLCFSWQSTWHLLTHQLPKAPSGSESGTKDTKMTRHYSLCIWSSSRERQNATGVKCCAKGSIQCAPRQTGRQRTLQTWAEP